MAKKQTPLRIIPLGGLDGIGKNMTAFEYGSDMILVDAGLMFPDDEQPGIDLILPDYSYVLENEEKLRGIIITHGHEDHTGALPYVLMDLAKKVPIYSSKLTLGIIEGKLAEHKINSPKFRDVSNGTHINLGAFSIDFFSMTHSIPGALGVYMRTPAGSVMHTGDFKLDQTPIDGVTPNYQAINRFATLGVDLLMSDSTNATRPGFTKSESAVGPAIRHIIKNAKGRVIVASFSSHIHRLQQICDASTAVGRKVVVTGRSMVQNTKIARELGYLKIDPDDIIDGFEVEDIPDDKIVVMCTGSQGEPMSALSRMANGDHKSFTITADDTVIISANPIPGNEKSVQGIINSLSKIGCAVYDKSTTLVHVSGHGSQEELKLMLAMAKPRFFMPVHGEAVHLRAHAKLAQEMGMRADHIFVADNGDTLEMVNGKVGWGRPVESGVVYVDGLSITDANPVVFRDRQKLASDGIVTVVSTVSKRSRAVGNVEISCRGVSFSVDDIANEAQETVRQTLQRMASKEGSNVESLRKSSRNSLSNYLWNKTRTRPMVIPVVMEV
ncbi:MULTISPECIES: ribonuclease J [Atopobiaceae]|uniref:Ribonuclease J n=1 Tax=Parafannyhessea umbonata TaxID=604330 RepID=A0A1H9QE79_9ACTN|nr:MULTISPECIES: ribonuclease J [Atopobiaceae]SEH61533.1 ribonuclease J [Parafannyhessea umbonata]SER58764.1 ribonuclease J [Parafannyhessea umbonata]SJZ79933.1 ribonuclease J [Olsenella sp. KH1P3]